MPTTLPDPTGGWTPGNVILVATVIVSLLTASLIPAIIAFIKAARAEVKAEASKSTAEAAHQQSTTAVATSARAEGKSEAVATTAAGLTATNLQQQGVLNKLQQEKVPDQPTQNLTIAPTEHTHTHTHESKGDASEQEKQ